MRSCVVWILLDVAQLDAKALQLGIDFSMFFDFTVSSSLFLFVSCLIVVGIFDSYLLYDISSRGSIDGDRKVQQVWR